MILTPTLCVTADAVQANLRAAALARQLLAGSGAPAVSVALLQGGRRGLAAMGERVRGTGIDVTRQDLWQIGSNAISMTAMLVARLVEADVIRWEDTVGQLMGDLALHQDLVDATFEMLLSDRCGLSRPAGPRLTRAFSAVRGAEGAERRCQKLLIRRGTALRHSDAGHVVVAAMLEAATDQSWEELITDWVFEPLALETAGFGPSGPAKTLCQPRGHGGPFPWSRRASVPDADEIAVMGPASGIHLSLADQLRYLSAHLRKPEAFLNSESWQKLHRDAAGQGHAMGWDMRNGSLLRHTGSHRFWFNLVLINPSEKSALVLALNTAPTARVRHSAQRAAASFLSQS
ncbi:hypothetical protein P775_09015 [Puniceibacterium antarcticum]|uniref:Beta-lactamase-related domain-containing protein n=1 Tax=Puniceibacterium antarcticum TaxID=1206336 RepID=A0A2G8RGG1_9RHOB|nr:serine hydrolase domain-containing protein [Puniceibacterium antarcticum]PIL20657.1 hypothetical protein P775_09015 [Puniceibacterium antarcticum]